MTPSPTGDDLMALAEAWAMACGNRDGNLNDRIASRQSARATFAAAVERANFALADARGDLRDKNARILDLEATITRYKNRCGELEGVKDGARGC